MYESMFGNAEVRVPGSAARAAARRLRKVGFQVLDRPESFSVAHATGPLMSGELDRARDWAARLGAATAAHSSG